MASKNLDDPTLITKRDELKRLAAKLSEQPIIAVDTESNSLYAYQEKVCLIQFSIPGEDYLVDPLALRELSALGSVFSSAAIEKVFHAAEYDLIVLQRDFGFSFVNLFDTMLAARILGWRAVGLSSILKNEFGVHVNKHFQRANWGQRPLPAKMLNYARLDTHYLIPLRQRQYEELKANNLWPLAEEDFQRATHVNTPAPNNDRASCWRINGAGDLPTKQLAILQELCRYRDRVAKSLNRP
ncbi:MAG: ribonuclease D, partial [Anaerolineales bacterium]